MTKTAFIFATLVALASPAMAANLPLKVPQTPAVAAPYNWAGFYAGVNVGYSWGHQDNSMGVSTTVLVNGTPVSTTSTVLENSDHLNGIIGGGQIGYNWQINHWVFGFEADFQGSGQRTDGVFNFPGILITVAGGPPVTTPGLSVNYTDKLDWFGTVRGRVGLAFDRWLPYVTGGWAFGNGETSVSISGAAATFSASKGYSGWTIGGGVEWAFRDNWRAKLEYLYIDFGDGPTGTAIVSNKLTDNIVRIGLNYKFN
jgi:outer membrane immunogenic protein